MSRALVILLLVIGCGEGMRTESTPDPIDSSAPDVTPPSKGSEGSTPGQTHPDQPTFPLPGEFTSRLEVIDADPREVINLVLTDAAGRSGLIIEKLRLTKIESDQWPDASLGCPQTGRVYAQVVSTGNRVVVDAGGEFLEYRVAPSGEFWLCDNG